MKIDVNFWFSLFSILKNTKVPNQKFFFLLIEYWTATFIFNLILSTIKGKMKQSGNFAFATMLQSVAWLSFSFFSGSVKIESIVLVEGFIHTVNFAASILSPWSGPLPYLKGWEWSERLGVSSWSFMTSWSVSLSSVHYSEQPVFGR